MTIVLPSSADITIVVEDGTIVPDANSYVTLEEFEQYAFLQGVDIPDDILERKRLLLKSKDYLESIGSLYSGKKVSPEQCLQFPRCDLYVDCFPVSPSAIPREIRYAQMQFALESLEGDSLNGGDVRSVSIDGAFSVSIDNSRPNEVNAFSKGQAMLSKLLKNSGITAVRS